MHYKRVIRAHHIMKLEKWLAKEIINIQKERPEQNNEEYLTNKMKELHKKFCKKFTNAMDDCSINVSLKYLNVNKEKLDQMITEIERAKNIVAQATPLKDLQCQEPNQEIFSSTIELNQYTQDINDFVEEFNKYELGTKEYAEHVKNFGDKYKDKIYFRSDQEKIKSLRRVAPDDLDNALKEYDIASEKLKGIIDKTWGIDPKDKAKGEFNKAVKPSDPATGKMIFSYQTTPSGTKEFILAFPKNRSPMKFGNIDLDSMEKFLVCYRELLVSMEEACKNSDKQDTNIQSKEILGKSSKLMTAAAGFVEGAKYGAALYTDKLLNSNPFDKAFFTAHILLMPILALITGICGIVNAFKLEDRKEQVATLQLDEKLQGFRQASIALSDATKEINKAKKVENNHQVR